MSLFLNRLVRWCGLGKALDPEDCGNKRCEGRFLFRSLGPEEGTGGDSSEAKSQEETPRFQRPRSRCVLSGRSGRLNRSWAWSPDLPRPSFGGEPRPRWLCGLCG